MMIYHYTSMESLYLILKNRTLRFTNLLNMDDLEEGSTKDYEYAKQYQYVSCWTEEKHESIPQWSIYSQGMKGVRIGIKIEEEKLMEYFVTEEDPIMKRLCPSNLHFHKTVPYLSDNGSPFIRKMEYTNDEQKLKPILTIFDGNFYGIDMSKLALYKSKVWEFQKEIRFVISFSPSPFNPDFSSKHDFNLEEAFKTRNIPFDFIDIELSEKFFEDLEITYGPKCPVVHKELIQMFVTELGIDPKIKESQLKIA